MLVVHADWSKHAAKRWMTVIRREEAGWRVAAAEPVGDVATLLARLLARAAGGAVALGIDCPIGLPRAYARLHGRAPDFPGFLRMLGSRPGFLDVAATLDEVAPGRPFYPARGTAGMTRLSHAIALGLPDAASLCRACDKATAERPAGAPLFWTLGANQSGKAAISAWRDLIGPALLGPSPPNLWPFDGPFRALLSPGQVVIAETYPAEALRQLGLRAAGSKRRRADRAAYAPALHAAMARLGARADTPSQVDEGFGDDAAGEDRLDCLLGALCVLGVVQGLRPDTAPDDPWITRWEGWVLGQTSLPRSARDAVSRDAAA
jgi:hypothetical protein